MPATALERNYEFEPYPGSRWFDPDGGEIPDESGVINAITGPDHCEWQSSVFLHLGWPLGHDAGDSSESRQYLRDPQGLFPGEQLESNFDGDVDLPRGAEFTGFQTDFMELWLTPQDGAEAAYLVFADHTERWPRATDPIGCD